jgi:hypothetical protein
MERLSVINCCMSIGKSEEREARLQKKSKEKFEVIANDVNGLFKPYKCTPQSVKFTPPLHEVLWLERQLKKQPQQASRKKKEMP